MRTLSLALVAVLVGCSGNNLTGETGTGTTTGGTGSGTTGGQASATSGTSSTGGPKRTFSPITVDGGTLSDLIFAVVGDTRPEKVDDTANYPSAVIDRIYADLDNLSPGPLLVIATGDYQYVQPGSGQSQPQIAQYLAAESFLGAPVLPAMGNHECNGYTASECGPNGVDGITENYSTFLNEMLAPLGANTAYYAVPLTAADGSWTAKVVCIAANAWDNDQAAWLQKELAVKTTYTFLVQHEPSTDSDELSQITQINAIVSAAQPPPTLWLVGHSHTFKTVEGVGNEVIVGNGGVPDTTGTFGFALVSRDPDGNLTLAQYDETSGMPTLNGVVLHVNAAGVVNGSPDAG